MFCMLLRKHFTGARLLELSQPSMERLLDFRFETLDELGDRVERRLVLECIGRKSNLIMLDGAGRITDCMRRAEVDLSAKRPVMPGLFYAPPEPTGRLDPAAMAPEELRSFVLANAPQGDGQDKWLLDTFNGLSPLTARELVFQGEGTREGLADRLAQLMERLGQEGIDSILLEGGGTLNWAALESGIVQKVQAYIAPKLFGGQTAKTPVEGPGVPSPDRAFHLKNTAVTQLGEDILLESEVTGNVYGNH